MTTQNRLKELISYNPINVEFKNIKPRQGAKPNGKVGCLSSNGYLLIGIDNVLYKAHRLAWLYVHGQLPTKQIDHINGNKSDNRIENLREASAEENQQNLILPKSNNKSGYLGVSKEKKSGRYIATITVQRKQKYLGKFDSPELASKAYLEAKKHLHAFARAL